MSEKRIPHYKNNSKHNKLYAPEKKLYRPEIHFGKATAVIVLVITFVFAVSFFLVKIPFVQSILKLDDAAKFKDVFFVFRRLLIIVLILTMRFILIWLVRIYQHYAKSEVRLRCRFTPSCSEYTILVLKRYGAIIGSLMAVRRLLLCGPRSGFNFPYAIDFEKCNKLSIIERISNDTIACADDTLLECETFYRYYRNNYLRRLEINIIWGNQEKLYLNKTLTDKLFKPVSERNSEYLWSDIKSIFSEDNNIMICLKDDILSIPFSDDENNKAIKTVNYIHKLYKSKNNRSFKI